MWEDNDLVVLEEDSGFGGPGCYRSVNTTKKEEVEPVLKDSPLVVAAEEVDLARGKEKHTGVFVEVFRNRLRFMELH